MPDLNLGATGVHSQACLQREEPLLTWKDIDFEFPTRVMVLSMVSTLAVAGIATAIGFGLP